MTAEEARRTRTARSAMAGVAPVVWLAVALLAAIVLRPAASIPVLFVLVWSGPWLGVLTQRGLAADFRTAVGVTIVLLALGVGVIILVGPGWLVCGTSVALPMRITAAIVGAAVAAGGYATAAWIIERDLRAARLTAIVEAVAFSLGIAFVTLAVLLGIYVLWIAPAITCVPR